MIIYPKELLFTNAGIKSKILDISVFINKQCALPAIVFFLPRTLHAILGLPVQ